MKHTLKNIKGRLTGEYGILYIMAIVAMFFLYMSIRQRSEMLKVQRDVEQMLRKVGSVDYVIGNNENGQ